MMAILDYDKDLFKPTCIYSMNLSIRKGNCQLIFVKFLGLLEKFPSLI